MTRDAPDETTDVGYGTSGAALLRSTARLHVLAEMSQAFAMVATDCDLLLEKIARTSADLIGDGCMVTLIAPDGETLQNAANAHRDPALEADYRAFLAGVGVNKVTSAAVTAQVVRTGLAKLVRSIEPATVVAQTDEALRPLVARINVHSFVVVPIRARQTIIGTLSLLRSGPDRGYTTEDLTMLQDVADRAGLAIENARLYGELERRVQQRTAELEAVNRELEAFSYSVAHDLSAPLRTIGGFADALLEEEGDRLGEQGRSYLARMRGASRRMSALIDDLLELAKIPRAAMKLERVDLSALAASLVEDLRQRHPGRSVTVEIAPGLEAQADPTLAGIALQNLLTNAWKFTGKREAAHIQFGRLPPPQAAYFVRDDGVGFDMAHAAELFEPFHRMHSRAEYEGTGVGLATVHRIVSRHGGRIWAESAPGAGATFYFTLGEQP
jgi:signal transduction histidine kinase